MNSTLWTMYYFNPFLNELPSNVRIQEEAITLISPQEFQRSFQKIRNDICARNLFFYSMLGWCTDEFCALYYKNDWRLFPQWKWNP